jgi:hypothetical protein
MSFKDKCAGNYRFTPLIVNGAQLVIEHYYRDPTKDTRSEIVMAWSPTEPAGADGMFTLPTSVFYKLQHWCASCVEDGCLCQFARAWHCPLRTLGLGRQRIVSSHAAASDAPPALMVSPRAV